MNTTHAISVRTSFRAKLILQLVAWTMPLYVRLFKRKKEQWTYSRMILLRLPQGTLGKDLGLFLQNEDLDLMPKLEEHDVMHLLLGYPTTVLGEIEMQFCLLGAGKRSLYAIGTVVLGLFLMPEYWGSYYRAYLRGKTCLDFSKWDFQYLLYEETTLLRQLIFQEKTERPNLFI